MILSENISMGLGSLRSNPLRSVLTLIGIAVGIAAVLYVVILGRITQESINKSLQSLGSNVLMIRPGESESHGVRTEVEFDNLTWDDARKIVSSSKVIVATVPICSGPGAVEYQDKNWNTRISGTTPDYEFVNNCKLIQGRFFTVPEMDRREQVCILGSTVYQELFGEETPLGKSILINTKRFQVVGLLETKGETWSSPDDQIFVPVTTAQERLYGVDYLNTIMAQVRSSSDYEEALFDIETTLRQSHRLRPDAENDFRVRRQDLFLSTIKETNTELSNFIILIALVSLIVGGIGVANVMLVSVTERIREIGIRRAIGAKRMSILSQFLIESIILSTVGGILGVLGGIALNLWVIKAHLLLPWVWIGYSLLICMGVGLISGMYPAYRAAHKNVIDALRYE
jgi:putative ABC transport system permease protein